LCYLTGHARCHHFNSWLMVSVLFLFGFSRFCFVEFISQYTTCLDSHVYCVPVVWCGID